MQPSASVRPASSIVTMRLRSAIFPGIAGSTGFLIAAFVRAAFALALTIGIAMTIGGSDRIRAASSSPNQSPGTTAQGFATNPSIDENEQNAKHFARFLLDPRSMELRTAPLEIQPWWFDLVDGSCRVLCNEERSMLGFDAGALAGRWPAPGVRTLERDWSADAHSQSRSDRRMGLAVLVSTRATFTVRAGHPGARANDAANCGTCGRACGSAATFT